MYLICFSGKAQNMTKRMHLLVFNISRIFEYNSQIYILVSIYNVHCTDKYYIIITKCSKILSNFVFSTHPVLLVMQDLERCNLQIVKVYVS